MPRANRSFAVALLIAAASPSPAQTVLEAAPHPTVALSIKGETFRARVGTNFDTVLFLNPGPAASAGLKPFPIVGKMKVKNGLLPGGEAVIRGNFVGVGVNGAKPARTPTIWADKPLEADFDGVISVLAVPGDLVVLNQPAAPRGGRQYIVQRAGADDMDAKVKLGGETVRVALDLAAPFTVMNARAAAAIEAEGLARRGREVGLWTPIPGVRLPFQRLVPAAGATLAGLPIVAPGARVTEARAREIDAAAKAGTSTADDDADAIVVTAKGDKPKGRAPWVAIGQDVLRFCSQLLMDRPGKRWVLTCAFPEG